MKVFLFFFYYRLYQWSEKRDKNIPLLITLMWITITLFFNVATLFSLISIATGVDMRDVLSMPRSKYAGAAWLSVWGMFIWGGFKLFHVHDKAFSDEMKKRYAEVGCKDWWVIAYFIVSYVLLAVTAWMAGKSMGLH